MKAIYNLEDWGLTESQLPERNELATIRLDIAYPGYQAVLDYPIAERRRRISALMRATYQALKESLPGGPGEKLGSHSRPTGIRLQLALRQLPALLTHEAVASIWVEEVAGMSRVEVPHEASFWSIKARFAIQIEGISGGLQGVEDRLLLVRALDEADAQRQLLSTFIAYAEPYLNSAGRLVRWQFERFLDAYQVGVWPLDKFLSGEYLEVFSETRNRKMTPATQWPAPETGS